MNVRQMKELEHQLLMALGNSQLWTPGSDSEKSCRDALQNQLHESLTYIQQELRKYVFRITKVEFQNEDGMTKAFVIYNDNDVIRHLFNFYPDEWTVESRELIGLTEQEARELGRKRDREYIQS